MTVYVILKFTNHCSVCIYVHICLCLCLAGIKAPSEPPKEPRNGSVPIVSDLPSTEDTGTIRGGGGGARVKMLKFV